MYKVFGTGTGQGTWVLTLPGLLHCRSRAQDTSMDILLIAYDTLHCAHHGLDKNIASTTAPEHVVLSVLSLGVALWTGQAGASEVAETCILILSINLISFCQSHGIVLVMASLEREMDSASRQWNTEKDVRNVRDFSVKRLPSGGSRRCMPQQTRYTGVCANREQKLCLFRSRPNPHCDWPRHCRWASSLVPRLWLARFISVWKAPPRWCYSTVRLALTQWRCSSNLTTAFGV